MKKNNNGFVLLETLIVTIFVAGVMIFLFTQFSSINKQFDTLDNYNSVENLYSLNNIKTFLLNDEFFLEEINSKVNNKNILNITDCENVSKKEYCIKLIELYNIKYLIISTNRVNEDLFESYPNRFKKFISRINYTGLEKYRLIAMYNNNTYSTVRFGEENE